MAADGRAVSQRPKLSVYWASSCGGCEIALVNLHERILAVDRLFDLVFCPCLLDTKKQDIEAMPERSIAITLFNGAVRTAENAEMARLLRARSQVLVAYGSCSASGGIPALSNLSTRQEHLATIFSSCASAEQAEPVIPAEVTSVPEGELSLPHFFEQVGTLAQTVEVDYFIPGCPPEPEQVWHVLDRIGRGEPLPPKGSVLGGGISSVCRECSREKSPKRIPRLYRNFEIVPDSSRCLLEQGLLCMGVATRDGCGALCPRVNVPCSGCYGPADGIADQGAKMLAALGSVLGTGEFKGVGAEEICRRTETAAAALADPAGTFYKYGLAGSILGGRRA